MKRFKQSQTMFIVTMIIDLILICPTFGIWIIIMIAHVLSYMNQYLIIGPKSVVLKTGIITTQTHDIRYSKINSIIVSKGILGNMFGFGNITIYTGNDVHGLKFKNIDNPDQVKREIDDMIEQNPLV